MNEMTVTQAREEAREPEKRLLVAIREFERDTGAKVMSVDLQRTVASIIGDREETRTMDVRVEIGL